MSIITREEIIRKKLENSEKGKLLFDLFRIAEELNIAKAIDLENLLSLAAMAVVSKAMEEVEYLGIDNVYTGITNVYYVLELYLRGFYNKEKYIGYEEFLNILLSGNANKLIHDSHEKFILHINRLDKRIRGSRRRIPYNESCYNSTKELLDELEYDLSICERYPATSANLTDFAFARRNSGCGPVLLTDLKGFIKLEEYVYSLYNEVSILEKLDEKAISSLCRKHYKKTYTEKNNLFELVMNNYIFAMFYSDEPEKLEISKVDAELLIREIKLGTLDVTACADQLINRYKLEGYRAAYMKKYVESLQERIKGMKDNFYFGELFFITD